MNTNTLHISSMNPDIHKIYENSLNEEIINQSYNTIIPDKLKENQKNICKKSNEPTKYNSYFSKCTE
jgi:hypothetical protein